MQTPNPAAPGAQATRLAVIRPTALPTLRPDLGPLPMDGDAGGGDGGQAGAGTAAGTIAPPAAPGGEGTGQAPTAPPAGQPTPAPQQDSLPPLFPTATPVTPPAGQPQQHPGQPAGGTPAPAPSERPLDQFPPEIRDYIAELRKESGDNRVKAKTAEDKAAEQMRTWLDGIAKTFGLIQDVPDDVPPEQQIARLGDQLTAAQTEHRAALTELAIWKAAAEAEANPQRLTDSRTFMRSVGGLDPSADDFDSKVREAIGTALAADEYFQAAGQVPAAAPPPVASGGDFGGGPAGGQKTGPQTVDDFREEMRQRRSRT